MGDKPTYPCHVVIIPFPTQGHIKPMLILAELLSQAGFIITFINTQHSHNFIDQADFRCRCPTVEFLTVPDGLPPDHPRLGPAFADLFCSITDATKPVLRSIIAGMSHAPSCVITDGLMSFANDVAEELRIPAISFRTDSAVATWSYFFFDKLRQEGEIPLIKEKVDMDELIGCIPGLENVVRRRDLPTMCARDPDSDFMKFFNTQTLKTRKASAIILNTFEELESPIISHLHSLFPAVYAIGPLHNLLNSPAQSPLDRSCLDWLDSQQPRSVLYVSFGTRAVLTRAELLEIWHGLVNSDKPFLWAVRPDMVWDKTDGPGSIPAEVRSGGKGRIVEWAPQEEVLAHEAVGGFFTHCGWNSILESVCAGKPMICRAMVVEQPLNSRFVGEVWKMGIDMKGDYDRFVVEKMVRELMEGGTREEIARSAEEFARLARNSVREGGSSRANINKLIQDIKLKGKCNRMF